MPEAGGPIVEIGAGPGNLTALLSRHDGDLFAVERDRDLCARLRARFTGQPRVHVIEADAKSLDLEIWARERPIVLCGNIPYNLSSPLLRLAQRFADRIEKVVYTLQKELGERLVARPGTRACGALSVALQQRFSASIVRRIRRGAFVPAPRVDSVLVELVPLEPVPFPVTDPDRLEQLLRGAFAQRRKQLHNTLAPFFSDPVAACHSRGIDPSKRAEQLSVEQWVELCNHPDRL